RSTGKNAKPARESKRSDGLKRIDLGGADINAHEQNNTVTITSRHAGSDISVVVPRSSNLTLKTLDGESTVEGVQGQIEANSLNGEVTMRSVSGTVIAHSLNGDVRVTLDRVEAKPMSFSTMNGDIDVTLPPDIKARFKMRNDHGDLFSDFDMTVEAAGPQVSETGGSRKIRFERTAYANVNGGGPEVSFRTVNGEIRIRKHK
ncbi:MAG TPA: DUF4097 family beta strand repeat-containing protein, partial [Bryobacteraceae bacterium]|nr:DUF4097 family beta strand repeat-containing protein [Bryobacteraceae bacterium]